MAMPAGIRLLEDESMSINRLFDSVDKIRDTAQWRAVFGEPETVEGKTLIPVAQVGYGFGLGFGQGSGPDEEEEEPPASGEGAGGGGGATAKPLGTIVVTPETVYFQGLTDGSKVALAGIGVAALLILQLAKTLRAIFGRS